MDLVNNNPMNYNNNMPLWAFCANSVSWGHKSLIKNRQSFGIQINTMPQITLFQWNKIISINLKNLFILRCGFISHNVTLFIKLTITFSFFFLLADRNTY